MSNLKKIILGISLLGSCLWIFVGIFDFYLVEFIFHDKSFISRLIYIIIGICALNNLKLVFKRKNDYDF